MKKIARKAAKKSDLLIFPEMSLTGYTLRDSMYEMAEEIPGPSTDKIGAISKEHGIHIIYGLPERSDKGNTILHNTAVLTGPKGYIGKYQKAYLPTHSVFEEKRYFRPGYETPVFKTELGLLGMVICYDIFFPEVMRSLRLQGAKLIVCISASPTARRRFFETLTQARAIENTCFVAYVNLVGIEDGLQFWGGSHLVAPNGQIITQAKYDEEDLKFGTVDYSSITSVEAFVPTLRDLRPHLYGSLKDLAEKL
jgi:predicted amidohydrolase